MKKSNRTEIPSSYCSTLETAVNLTSTRAVINEEPQRSIAVRGSLCSQRHGLRSREGLQNAHLSPRCCLQPSAVGLTQWP